MENQLSNNDGCDGSRVGQQGQQGDNHADADHQIGAEAQGSSGLGGEAGTESRLGVDDLLEFAQQRQASGQGSHEHKFEQPQRSAVSNVLSPEMIEMVIKSMPALSSTAALYTLSDERGRVSGSSEGASKAGFSKAGGEARNASIASEGCHG